MILSTLIVAQILVGIPKAEGHNLVYLGLKRPSVEFVDLYAEDKVDEENCSRLNLEYVEVGEDTFVWEREFYNTSEAKQRLNLWEKLANGELKSGDVVNLGEFYGSVSTKQSLLDDSFGINEKNSESVSAIIGDLKTVTLEAADGSRQSFIIPQSYEIDMSKLDVITPFKPLDLGKQTAPSPRDKGIDRAVHLEYFGQWNEDLDKLAAGERFLKYLYDRQLEEQTQLNKFVNQWENLQSGQRAAQGSSLTDLTESDRKYLDDVLQRQADGGKWKPYKIVEAETTPYITVRILVEEHANGYSSVSPILPIDRPVSRFKKTIRPSVLSIYRRSSD